jgi:hypothetical protein
MKQKKNLKFFRKELFKDHEKFHIYKKMDSGRFFIEQIRFQKQKRKFFAKQNYFGLEKQDTD